MEENDRFDTAAALLWVENPGTHWVGGSVGRRASLDISEEKESSLVHNSCCSPNAVRAIKPMRHC